MNHLKGQLKASGVLDALNETVKKAREKVHRKKESLTQKLVDSGVSIPLVDLEIQFIGANGLPKMDVVGSADPYFVAKLDDRITFVSNVIKNTLSPVWNEVWRVKNVPSTASLRVEVWDKDEGSATDDYIGKSLTSVTAAAKELEIEAPSIALRKSRGTFWLKVESTPSTMRQQQEFQYLFDGPIRFTRHFSPTVGLFTASSTVRAIGETPSEPVHDPRLYSTWKFHIKGVPLFFRDVHQPWNRDYPAAQKIFGQGPTSLAVRGTVQAGHSMLYARFADNGSGILDTRNKDNPEIEEPISLKEVLHAGGSANERIKPAVYTYIISSIDDTLRFSETGAAFFVDFASKHALHANCAPQVDWELVVDNNSGTYAPDKMVLPTVQECLESNFGCGLPSVDPARRGFRVVVYDREDPRLVESREACREYAVRVRGVRREELQPHVQEGEVPLSATVASGSEQRFSQGGFHGSSS
ncbi:hypothetical protein CC1G_03612 [Coprinopsis cinerea okayama7|uniref:C2 domain-containing protein n=1 Tax=Coprinopsis cinerea (strain Okayama-7 / 130 / ATCC MYA-4618 / FGSC 9003) TaxID=240176 RepID=A8NCQ4_COPC7|nr:hypothetical protein CC1G_03612 [Coprinopsis cinerea okayama7\|eukprot:XP_001832598.2 hypothetical protein CC1G_03612 [Coprinopsis cinerea okayama7\